MISIGGISLHLYGLILGVAIALGIWFGSFLAQSQGIDEKKWWRIVAVLLVCGLIGARGYYIILHWSWYGSHLEEIVQFWHGGSSIIGGFIGGAIGVYAVARYYQLSPWAITDAVVFGLPFAQALGRWGNYVNQELYGLPTALPWGLYIEPEFRVPPYQQFEYFHPLFAYEMIALCLLGVGMWWWLRRIKPKETLISSTSSNHLQLKEIISLEKLFSGWKIGSGHWTKLYIYYYSIIRFLLDFIRINKTQFLDTKLSITQIFLAIILITLGSWEVRKNG